MEIFPPFVEKLVTPGSRLNDVISYTNQGDVPLKVTVSIVDFDVNAEGRVVELPAGTQVTTLAPFVRITPLEITVPPKQRVFFRYSVRAPEEFQHLRSMIYFLGTPHVEAKGASQVVLVPRLGIPIYVENIRADAAKLRVEEIDWERSGEQKDFLTLKMVVTNEGKRILRPDGFVEARSSEDGSSAIFRFNPGKEPVLPGHTRIWTQVFGPVPGGELFLKLRFASSPRTIHESEHRIGGVASSGEPSGRRSS